MTPYVAVMATALIFSCLWQYFEREKQSAKIFVAGHLSFAPHWNHICLFIAFTAMWLLPSLIVSTGGDYWNYRQMFYNIEQGGTSYAEIGFRFICRVIQLFTSNAQVLFIVFNCLSYILFFKCVKDYSVCFPISVLACLCWECISSVSPKCASFYRLCWCFTGIALFTRGSFGNSAWW